MSKSLASVFESRQTVHAVRIILILISVQRLSSLDISQITGLDGAYFSNKSPSPLIHCFSFFNELHYRNPITTRLLSFMDIETDYRSDGSNPFLNRDQIIEFLCSKLHINNDPERVSTKRHRATYFVDSPLAKETNN